MDPGSVVPCCIMSTITAKRKQEIKNHLMYSGLMNSAEYIMIFDILAMYVIVIVFPARVIDYLSSFLK